MREICGNLKENSEIVKRRLSQNFCSTLEQDRYSQQIADHFALHHEHLFAIFEHSTSLPNSSYTHYTLAIHRA
jgi:hypothetical protein